MTNAIRLFSLGMSKQERTVFDQAVNEHKRRLDSFTLRNGGKDQQGKK
jgi:hypothetical protein